MSKHSIFIFAISTALTACASDRITYEPQLDLFEQMGATPEAKKAAENKHRTAHIYRTLENIREHNWVDLGTIKTLIYHKADLEVPITKQWGERSETMTVLTKAIKQDLPYVVKLLINSGAKIPAKSLQAAYKQANPEILNFLMPTIEKKRLYRYPPEHDGFVDILSPLDCVLQSPSEDIKPLRKCFIMLMYNARIDPYALCQREDQQHGRPCHRCFALANPDEKKKLTIPEKAFVDALSEATRDQTRKALKPVMSVELANIIGRYAF